MRLMYRFSALTPALALMGALGTLAVRPSPSGPERAEPGGSFALETPPLGSEPAGFTAHGTAEPMQMRSATVLNVAGPDGSGCLDVSAGGHFTHTRMETR